MTRRLLTIPISHFCEKARWALERTGLDYREERHVRAGAPEVTALCRELDVRDVAAFREHPAARSRCGCSATIAGPLPPDLLSSDRWQTSSARSSTRS